jgi:hypothetical protein
MIFSSQSRESFELRQNLKLPQQLCDSRFGIGTAAAVLLYREQTIIEGGLT